MLNSFAWWRRWWVNGFLEMVTVSAEAGREQLLVVLALAVACGLAIAIADLPPAARTGVATAVLVRLVLQLRGMWPGAAEQVIRVMCLPGGSWRLETGSGTVGAQLLHAWGRSLGPLIALEWRCDDGRRRRAWLWRHRCPQSQWRRLRVQLRMT